MSLEMMTLRIWDVDYGTCATLGSIVKPVGGRRRLGRSAMIDSGNSKDWRPNPHLQAGYEFPFEYRFVTHVDQTHVSIVRGLALPTVETKVLYRNPSYTEAQFREMKARSGALTKDGEWYAAACSSRSTSAIERFNEHMDGITAATFWNRYPAFTNPNDLSLAVFIKYAGFSILFPGDLEKPGWLALLEDPAFREELGQVTILVASHQGREKGFCREVFRYCKPRAVVVSNKPVNYSSREVLPDYKAVTVEGVDAYGTHSPSFTPGPIPARRRVLTTERDGWIQFAVARDGNLNVYTEHPP